MLYLKVMDAERASYGISDYLSRSPSSRRPTLRSEIGKIDLDRTFEERTHINTQVVTELDKASEPWGVKVLRYEIKNITPPEDVLAAMEKQMRAEREKRAVILTSEGERDAAINTAEGEKQQVIKAVGGDASSSRSTRPRARPRRSSRSRDATAEGIRKVADAIQVAGRLRGGAAARRRAVHRAVRRARQGRRHHVILPANLADVASMISLAMKVVGRPSEGGKPA